MTMAASLSGSRNALLGSLNSADYELIAPFLHPVRLRARQRLELGTRRIRAAYFIERGLVSVVAVGARDRQQVEIAPIGREGMTGLALVLGMERSPHDAIVQIEGSAQCIPAPDLKYALRSSTTLAAALLRYAYVWNVALAQTVLANARGSLEERLARWLLMAHDRIANDEIRVTHDLLSFILGIRRAGVTTALNAFDTVGFVGHSRGRITIIDREGLQRVAGGHYGIPEAEYDRAFSS